MVFPTNMKDPQALPSIMKKKHLTPINRDSKNANIFSSKIQRINSEARESAEQLGNLLRKFNDANPKEQSFITPKNLQSHTPNYDYMVRQATGLYQKKSPRRAYNGMGY